MNRKKRTPKVLPFVLGPVRVELNQNMLYHKPVPIPPNMCMMCRQAVDIATIYQAKNPRVQVRLCQPCTDKLEGREPKVDYQPRMPDTPWALDSIRQLQASGRTSWHERVYSENKKGRASSPGAPPLHPLAVTVAVLPSYPGS